ncbi:39S ribosomal protein L50, mitochondrial [Ischnura elegans]|uniref:39S ribosomal protein L50, mitochondrial n=1 Tax=Ischnura elegans TaxID=197161 RepID=UPI001ED88875|nr:39S ribosomal protein L50, mitochondrial [Ischnura elegans]
MAALLKHGIHIRSHLKLPSVALSLMRRECSNVISSDDLPSQPKLKDNAVSLSFKGFLRSHTPYSPPEDVENQLHRIGNKYFGSKVSGDIRFDNAAEKFKVLAECNKVFKHCVPNSELHSMVTFGDVIGFYLTPVVTTTPLDEMKTMKLPPNLHVQHDYVRFQPDTDVMFGGISAFPKSSTIVTGLKYRKKYKGYKAKTSWP